MMTFTGEQLRGAGHLSACARRSAVCSGASLQSLRDRALVASLDYLVRHYIAIVGCMKAMGLVLSTGLT